MERPSDYTTAGIALLVAGTLNLWIGAILFLTMVWFCVGILWLFPIVIGMAELVTGIRMLTGKRVHSAVPVAALGVFASMMNFNVLSIAGEVIALALVTTGPVARWLSDDDDGASVEW